MQRILNRNLETSKRALKRTFREIDSLLFVKLTSSFFLFLCVNILCNLKQLKAVTEMATGWLKNG